jgi:Pyruvate/2-oxoacid:ferredoxin oxidoreductase delta subunit
MHCSPNQFLAAISASALANNITLPLHSLSYSHRNKSVHYNKFIYLLLHYSGLLGCESVSLGQCWKWCPQVSIQAWTRLILFAKTFCKSAFGNSLCVYKRCWKWCPRASIQAWTKSMYHSLCAQRFSECTVYWRRGMITEKLESMWTKVILA